MVTEGPQAWRPCVPRVHADAEQNGSKQEAAIMTERTPRPCLLCGTPTLGATGAAGIFWPSICGPCKDAEDRALDWSVRGAIAATSSAQALLRDRREAELAEELRFRMDEDFDAARWN